MLVENKRLDTFELYMFDGFFGECCKNNIIIIRKKY